MRLKASCFALDLLSHSYSADSLTRSAGQPGRLDDVLDYTSDLCCSFMLYARNLTEETPVV